MSTNIHDAAVSTLPDLSENLSNEERTWEEIMQIKAMPLRMSQKMQLKNQLQVPAIHLLHKYFRCIHVRD